MKFVPLTIATTLLPFSVHVAGSTCTRGKLYMTSRNTSNVHVFDLNGSVQNMVSEKVVTLPSSTTNEFFLDVSDTTEVVAVVYRGTLPLNYTDGKVQWIHTGLEGTTDSFNYKDPKMLSNSTFTCTRPIHFAPYNGKIGIFCDGYYGGIDSTILDQFNTSVWVIDESKLITGQKSIVYNKTIDGSHHGVAFPTDDDHILYTVATPERAGRYQNASMFAVPWTFDITNYNGVLVHQVNTITNKDLHCSGYHGSTAKDDTFVFACDGTHGGVLIVKYNNVSKTYTSRALLYPPGYNGHRSGTLNGHSKSDYVVGNFNLATNASLIAFKYSDTASMLPSNRLALPVAQCAFDFEKSDGEYILAFFPNGTLSVYTYSNVQSWKWISSTLVIPNMTACSQGAFISGYGQAFAVRLNPPTLYTIDLSKLNSTGSVDVATSSLPYTPLSMVVAGAPERIACNKNKKQIATPTKAPTVAPPVPAPVPNKAPAPVPVTVPIPASSPMSLPLPVTPPSSPLSCGLFGLSIFCPFTFCGFFGRLLGMCSDS